MTDFRALCAELHAAFNTYAVDQSHHELLQRARAALAEPEPEGPTDEELLQVFNTVCLSEGGTVDEIYLRGLRAVLALLGQPSRIS